jgi:hypothetical protein
MQIAERGAGHPIIIPLKNPIFAIQVLPEGDLKAASRIALRRSAHTIFDGPFGGTSIVALVNPLGRRRKV